MLGFLRIALFEDRAKTTAAPSVCDIQELYFKLHISATNVR